MTIHYATAATIACNADDCQDSVRVIAGSQHSAGYEASQLARYDGWEAFEAAGMTFHRCPMHRSDAPVSLVKSYV